MAPFMAIPDKKAKVEEDLNWLYDNNVAYTKNFWDGSTAKILWRYSVQGFILSPKGILSLNSDPLE